MGAYGTVLDPFMGSGTTGVAATKHGRKFIGIDKAEKWVKRTEQRISEMDIQRTLFDEMVSING